MLWPVSTAPVEEKARTGTMSPGLMTICLGGVAYRGFCLWSLGGVLISLRFFFLVRTEEFLVEGTFDSTFVSLQGEGDGLTCVLPEKLGVEHGLLWKGLLLAGPFPFLGFSCLATGV